MTIDQFAKEHGLELTETLNVGDIEFSDVYPIDSNFDITAFKTAMNLQDRTQPKTRRGVDYMRFTNGKEFPYNESAWIAIINGTMVALKFKKSFDEQPYMYVIG